MLLIPSAFHFYVYSVFIPVFGAVAYKDCKYISTFYVSGVSLFIKKKKEKSIAQEWARVCFKAFLI